MKKISILLLAIVVFFLFVEYKTSYIKNDNFFNDSRENVWAHAGTLTESNHQKNSIEAFKNAIDHNFKGTELDVFYDVKKNDFIVSHDFPYNLKNGKILHLKSVFYEFNNTLNYWLDFKNLEYLSKKEAKLAKLKLLELIDETGVLKNKILIESQGLENLSCFTDAQFYTSWWIYPSKSRYLSILSRWMYKYYYSIGRYSSLSMKFNYYPRVSHKINNIPINLFTINDKNILNSYLKSEKVQIILTDMSE